MDELQEAIKKTKGIKKLADNLKNQGKFKSVLSTFSGKNDKDLANMVSNLSSNVGVTQAVLQLMMQVQNARTNHLREFHDALVRKVTLIEDDTSTLNENQRVTAVAIVNELREQVSSQIEQQERVEAHQRKLQEMEGSFKEKEMLDSEQDKKLSSLEEKAFEIIQTDERQQALIEQLKESHASKDELDKIQTQRIDSLVNSTSQLEVESKKLRKGLGYVEAQQELIIKQVEALEVEQQKSSSLKNVVIRQVPSVLALIAAGYAILLHS
ncbi:hypothetical protein V6D52_13375 [Idiomarina loihiensis]